MAKQSDNRQATTSALIVLIAAVGGITLAVLLAYIGYRWSGVGMVTPRTEFAQWLPAVSSTLTLAAAVAAAIFAAGAFRIEDRRERQAVAAAEQSQAITIAAWGAGAGVARSGTKGGDTVTYHLEHAQLMVRNGSQLPIYDLHFVARLMSTSSSLNDIQLTFLGGVNTIPLIAPDLTIPYNLPRQSLVIEAREGFDGNSSMPSNHIVVGIQFRDTAGTYWRRHSDGTFEKGAGDIR